MCGRFDLIKKQQDLERYYHKTSNLQSYKPNYNASPAQTLPVVTSEAIEGMHWGLVPQWAKGINTGYSMINS
ncbi:MAG TPA: SOS response-associated peptidase family protein, partial [Candidatus Saccharimonadales bacterium]|nr:SOS response-associated peptidase family protein [Candidatus Saccharimonadales bacterium]